jgi:hypothetical protein
VSVAGVVRAVNLEVNFLPNYVRIIVKRFDMPDEEVYCGVDMEEANRVRARWMEFLYAGMGAK